MAKIFITGVTGYIGGDALYALAAAHPEYEITASVRTAESAARVAKEYPKLRLVIGDLDATDLLREEASKADVVINAAEADHAPALKALIAGLLQRPTPGALIHTSGTGALLIDDILAGRVGEPTDKVYSDWGASVRDVTTGLPSSAPHRETDVLLLSAGGKDNASKIRTAIVAPPAIYGPGRGPSNKRSIQAPNLVRAILQRGKGIKVRKGLAVWSTVHVQDLSQVYVLLTEAALAGKEEVDGVPLWGEEAYYFAENGELVWGEAGAKIAEIAHSRGLIASKEVDEVTGTEANQLARFGAAGWGMNSRSQAVRARKLLGWSPKEKSLMDELPDLVESEAKALKLV